MRRQVSLFTRKVAEVNRKFEKADQPWTGVCCEACWNATGKRCECKCHGVYHGKGRVRKLEHDHVSEYHEVMNHYEEVV